MCSIYIIPNLRSYSRGEKNQATSSDNAGTIGWCVLLHILPTRAWDGVGWDGCVCVCVRVHTCMCVH